MTDIWDEDNVTSYKPGRLPITSGSRWTRVRRWLIKRLAGDMTVMLNFAVTGKIAYPHADVLMHSVEVVQPFEIGPRAASNKGTITVRRAGR